MESQNTSEAEKRTLDKKSRILKLCLDFPTIIWWPLAPADPQSEHTMSFSGESGEQVCEEDGVKFGF